ncbi:ammonium transporter [Caulobacter sp. 17J65-9]|nr:ammonium transporter [Caulobacter sp. 17J65-9]
MLVVALVASYARHHGYVDSDTVTRLVVGLNGLMIAWFGNRIPKTVVPSACARQAQRVAGWSMVLSGLAYAGLWAFAPMQVAITAGCGAVIAGIAVTIGYCLWLRSRAKAA